MKQSSQILLLNRATKESGPASGLELSLSSFRSGFTTQDVSPNGFLWDVTDWLKGASPPRFVSQKPKVAEGLSAVSLFTRQRLL